MYKQLVRNILLLIYDIHPHKIHPSSNINGKTMFTKSASRYIQLKRYFKYCYKQNNLSKEYPDVS